MKIYYCANCKKMVENFSELITVSDNPKIGFCSGECVDQFYHFMHNHFQRRDADLRNILEIKSEPCLKNNDNPKVREEILRQPTNIFRVPNEFHEDIYVYIRDLGQGEVKHIAVLLLKDFTPTHVIFSTSTYSELHVKNYMIGKEIENLDPYIKEDEAGAMEFDDDMIDFLELKKSTCLATMMGMRKEADIPFESFVNFLDCHSSTLKAPDYVVRTQDDDGDDIYVYIKAHDKENISYFYIVLAVPAINRIQKKSTLIPIFGFPTIDPELISFYKQGTMVKTPLNN